MTLDSHSAKMDQNLHSSIKILILYDGKPGHLSQAQGLAQLIKDKSSQPVEIRTQSTRPALKLLNRPLRRLAALTNHCATDSTLSRLLTGAILNSYRQHPPSTPVSSSTASQFTHMQSFNTEPADLVISFGGNVVALNVALAKHWNAGNLAIGNRYSLPAECFSAHITMSGNSAEPQAIASHIALSKTDIEECERKGALYAQERREKLNDNNTRFWSLLIGGDGSGYQYSSEDWKALATGMAELSSKHGIHWLLSTSRRTPVEAEHYLKQALSESHVTASFYHCDQNIADMPSLMGAAERIFCTEDSLSMINESVALGKPVISLQPATLEPSNTHQKSMTYLNTCGLIERVALADLGAVSLTDYQPSLSYQKHLDLIYDQLRERFKKLDERTTEQTADHDLQWIPV